MEKSHGPFHFSEIKHFDADLIKEIMHVVQHAYLQYSLSREHLVLPSLQNCFNEGDYYSIYSVTHASLKNVELAPEKSLPFCLLRVYHIVHTCTHNMNQTFCFVEISFSFSFYCFFQVWVTAVGRLILRSEHSRGQVCALSSDA